MRLMLIASILMGVVALAACGAGEPETPATATAGPTPGALAAVAATATPALPAAPATALPATASATVASAVAATGTVGAATLTATATPSAAQAAPAATATGAAEPTVAPTTVHTPTAAAQADLNAVQVKLDPIATGLDRPLFATHAGDGSGRIFVVGKGGVISVIQDGELQAGPFLDIGDRVLSSGYEQGLLGLAFHPQFAGNGRFFVYYTDQNGNTVVSRFQANDARTAGDPASETVLLTQDQPAANHNGGMIAFGPDGMLYIGLGDGGRAGDPWGNGQSLATWLGKILRIDVDGGEPYAIPAGNPFAGQSGAKGEIWAYGLRNPWRFSFDRATGDLYIADVGQNQWEEIDVQSAGSAGGENYGWDVMEGRHCYDAGSCDQSGKVLPVAEYDHDQGCSVTGGYVYRGAAQPSLQGIYFYGDYCSGAMWALARDANDQWQSVELPGTDLQISSFGETEDGEVLVVDLTGAVYRLVAG